MKYIDADKLIAEIERQILDARSHGWHISEKYCEEILNFAHSLQQEQPDGLDEAAEGYVQTLCDRADENLRIDTTLQSAFKAGAEWMQNRIMSKTFEDEPLDSAARNIFADWIPMELLYVEGQEGKIPLYNQGALIMMFQAGAKWLASQGVTVKGLQYGGSLGIPDIPEEFYTDKQEEVIVQIRKK